MTSPNGGTITLTETAITGTPPSGFGYLGQQVDITAPDASVEFPLVIVFEIDDSVLPAGGVANVVIFRNGGPPLGVPGCTGAPQAIPDPCVASRITLGNGNGQVTVLSSAASIWNAGVNIQTPPSTVPALNPAGKCVMLGATSDIVRNPAKHPRWTVLGGSTCPPRLSSSGAGFSLFWLPF